VAQPPASRAKTILLLAPPGLSYDDLRPGGPLAVLRERIAPSGAVGLLNAAVSGEATDAAAYLSVGAGDRMSAPNRSRPPLLEGGVPVTVAELAAEVFTIRRGEGAPTRATYERRFGIPLREDAAVAHVGVPALRAAQPSLSRAGRVGAMGEALRRAGRRVGVYGGWPAALAGMDTDGVVPDGNLFLPLLPKEVAPVVARADVVVFYATDKHRLKQYARAAFDLAGSGAANALIVAPAPPRNGMAWVRLGFVVALGPDFPAGTVLTSPTTRTPGLIANVDIAPTVLALQGADAPPGGVGRPVATLPAVSPWDTLSLLDRQTTATAKASVPLMIAYGAFAILSGLLALLALHFNNRPLAVVAHAGLLVSAAVLLALLPAGWFAPSTVTGYVLSVFVTAGGLAVVATVVGSLVRRSPLGILFALLVAAIAVDAAFGAPLMQRAINNFLPGIRFYGVGNEYMGIALGAALMGTALLSPLPRWVPVTAWATLVLLVSLPALGAKAGGALTTTFTFTLAWFCLRTTRVRGRHVAAAFAFGLFVLALQATYDMLRPADVRTHIGEAVATGKAHGIAPLLEIASRKIAMNAALTATPYTAAGLAGLVPLWWLLAHGTTGARARAAIAARPELARLLAAAYAGALVALVFNDSGIVAALLLLACPTAAVLLAMLEDANNERTTC
jgi:hypothetical protein